MKQLILDSFAKIGHTNWKNACEHVCDIEKTFWKKDNIQSKEVEPVVIRLGESSDDDTDSSSDRVDSENDDTEDYEYC